MLVGSELKSSHSSLPREDAGGTPVVQKKPEAKGPNYKRDMTYQEKQKLIMDLQSLPDEKVGAFVRIIMKSSTRGREST